MCYLEVSEEDRRNYKIWKKVSIFHRILMCCLEPDIRFSGQCRMCQYCPKKPYTVDLQVFGLATPAGTVCDVQQSKTTCPD